MSQVATAPLMTSEELLTLPDDGIERDLIDGQLQEREMTKRNRRHSRATVRIARFLDAWVDNQMDGRGEVLAGEAAFRLRRDPDTTVGIDVAYISAELSAESPDYAFIIDGVPVLAVEILSPSDTHGTIVEKRELYLEAGVAVIWIVDPDLRYVNVHRPGTSPKLFNETEELVGEPELHGFRVRVADLFAH